MNLQIAKVKLGKAAEESRGRHFIRDACKIRDFFIALLWEKKKQTPIIQITKQCLNVQKYEMQD